MSDLPPANWYPDPEVPGQQRYWDGTQWTEHRAPGAGSAPQEPGSGPGGTQPIGESSQPAWGQPADQPAWGQQQPYGQGYAQPAAGSTNGLAIASLVLAIVWLGGLGAIAAVVLGIIALRQVNASRGTQGGRGLAIAGTIIGGLGILGAVAFWAIFAFVTTTTTIEPGSTGITDFFECLEQEAQTGQDLDC